MNPALERLSTLVAVHRVALGCVLITAVFAALASERVVGLLRNLPAITENLSAPTIEKPRPAPATLGSEALNPFGDNPALAGPAPKLDISLVGVFASSAPDSGSALITTGSGKTRLVKAGSAIAEDVSLELVYADHAIFNVGDRSHTVYLPRADENAGPVSNTEDEREYRAQLSTRAQREIDVRKRLLQLQAAQ